VEQFSSLLRKHHGISGIRSEKTFSPTWSLEQNYPNPFNPATMIRVHAGHDADASVRVYDILGREVDRMFEGRMERGTHLFRFDPGVNGLPTGIYFYTIRAGDVMQTKKMLFIR
jgi:hypothetical protein